MATEVATIDDALLARAATLLAEGQLVAFPTDTVYGVGASVESVRAVDALYRVKQRPRDKPFAVLVSGAEMARSYATCWPAAAERLAAAFWPGPLTLVVPRSSRMSAAVVCGGDTVALRVADHPAVVSLSTQLGAGIAAPSANMSGEPPPTTAAAVMEQLGGRIPLVLDGGACAVGVPSTIVQVADDGCRVLRHGAIAQELLAPLMQ